MKVSIIKVFDLLIKFRKLRIREHMILIEKVKENLSARKFSAGRGTRSSKMNVASRLSNIPLKSTDYMVDQ